MLLLLVAAAGPKFGLIEPDAGATVAPPPSEAQCRARFRPAERACTTDADCSVVNELVSCCGTRHILGVRSDDVARYEAQLRECPPVRQFCKCLEGPTQLDDGSSLIRETGAAVTCRANVCTTYRVQRLIR
jgi:hypothetical protein